MMVCVLYNRSNSMKATTILAAMMMMFVGCSTAPKTEEKRENLHAQAIDTMENFRRVDPGLKTFLDKCYGYAVFPTVGKGGLIVGGAYGHGEVYEQGVMIGYCDLSQATIGAQIGGQSYGELIAFQNEAALNKFKRNELAFSAQVSAVALKSGASADAKFTDGVAVFTMANGGAMLEASVGGQQFTFKPKETAPVKSGM
jgi:lipid-binding SYLF domain-containing protein